MKTQIILLLMLTGLCCCRNQTPLELIEPSHSGITFNNELTESDTLNVLTFEYIYNGGGVGVSDFNNDGRSDLFFTGNMVSSRLYLNQGDFHFKDITGPSGVTTSLWCTGVSVADIDQDGWMDIYVSTVNPDIKKTSPNLLFRNKGLGANGIPVFEEIAAKVGLDDKSYSTQSVFLDYDLDGDLDMYLLTNALENYTRNSPIGQHSDGTGKSVDKLFRNEGIQNGLPSFTDVSATAGILSEGWGLGIVVNDINLDGLPDIYVANDFLSNDHLYINNGDGTFTNRIQSALKHQEYNGMGADIGDINNDGLQDILVVDMLPEDNLRQKTMFSTTGYDRFQKNIQMRYQPQYVRNVLQLNNGNGTFSDIGYLAGVYATDWSWSALMADMDNDGYQDIIITNGYRKDITDLDFIAYSKESSHFGTDKTRMQNAMKAIQEIEGVKKHDLLFRNQGNLRFEDVSVSWGMTEEAYGNGAAYADLDNDGDLDLVINNINDKAYLYRNNVNKIAPGRSHYLRVQLKGNGLGSRVDLYTNGKIQTREYQTQRGYQSTVEPFVHFGLDSLSMIDSVVIRWPDGRKQSLNDVKSDQVLVVNQNDAVKQSTRQVATSPLLFKTVEKKGLKYRHDEDDHIDFKATPTLPQKYSQAGPAMAVGDINSDGLEDVVLCGAANRRATIFYQRRDGGFDRDSLTVKQPEDAGILLFDADQDSDLDLYCVSGSTEFGQQKEMYVDRLYRNNGNALVLDATALPPESSSGSTVVSCDYDKDGDLDLFIGGRNIPGRYPEAPESLLLENDGKGKFQNVTETRALDLQHVGMITAALWTDFDNDGWIDLAVVGEWMPVTFFHNQEGKAFSKVFSNSTGWWNSIAGGDFDHDGDIDYICGNLGLNSLFHASVEQPVSIYAKDFDGNGSFDPLISRYIDSKEYLTHPRETLTDQIASYKKKLTRYSIYGKSTRQNLLSDEQLKDALIYRATTFTSSYIENLGSGRFAISPLPVQAQISVLNGIQVSDVNNDGNLDVIAIGNSYASDPLAGLQDAGTGVVMLGNGDGSFSPLTLSQSGFFVATDAKALVSVENGSHGILWLASSNRDSLKVFEQQAAKGAWIHPGPGDVRAELEWGDGKKEVRELYYGSGYLSQSTRSMFVQEGIKHVILIDGKGEKRKVR